MPKTRCTFQITSPRPYRDAGPNYTGVCLPSPQDVDKLASVVGLVSQVYPTATIIEVDLDEEDIKYQRLIQYIALEYGWFPNASKIIKSTDSKTVYFVNRCVAWTMKEISSASLLALEVSAIIAHQSNGSIEQVDNEILSYSDVSGLTKMGVVKPFHGIGVASDLVKLLDKENLLGLHFTPGVDTSGKSNRQIFALRSNVIMPQSLTPLINEAGDVVPPNTEWWCFHDDGGRSPGVLRYREAEVRALGTFDIAMTYERVGFRKSAAYRWCIVSQKFREVLKKLKVRAVNYIPVVLE